MSLLLTCELLALFVSTLTAHGKYSLCTSGLFLEPIQL